MSIYPPVRDEMIRLLSVPRLATYTAACDGDVKRALELYRWNLTVSTAFFESIHYFEVAFRNCVDGAVAAWVATGEPEVTSWFDDSTVPLSEGAWRQVQQAKERIVDAGGPGRGTRKDRRGVEPGLLGGSALGPIQQDDLGDLPQGRLSRHAAATAPRRGGPDPPAAQPDCAPRAADLSRPRI